MQMAYDYCSIPKNDLAEKILHKNTYILFQINISSF